MKKVLIVSANPIDTARLGLDEEVREIQAKLKCSKYREEFEVIPKLAVRFEDLSEALLENNPQIVHFSGHGNGTDGIFLLQNESSYAQLVGTQVLSNLFKLFKNNIECVVLNACYSQEQAEAIFQHIDCVIGMKNSLHDRTAINFSKGFYSAIFAGKNYNIAFELGCINVSIENSLDSSIPLINIRQDIGDILRIFRSKALLLAGVQLSRQQAYRIHDLMHEMAKGLLTAEDPTNDLPGLGLTLSDAHALLLKSYRAKTKNGLWHTLPNDGYIHAHLSWHLQQANQIEAIHELLQEETSDRHNGWYEACDRIEQTARYLTDVSRAWKLVENSWTEATLPQAIGLQCRYALTQASFNSLAANLPKDLLVALVKKNVWAPEKGLAYALQTPHPEQRVYSLVALFDHLPQNLKEQAEQKALARAIVSERNRAAALDALAHKLPTHLLSEALAAARAIGDESSRAFALSALIPALLKIPSAQLFLFWQNTLHELSLRTRKELLRDIETLVPIIFSLGGQVAVTEVVRAICDVTQWWR